MTFRRLLARNRDFRLLWSGQVVSEIGDWLNNIAVLALALEIAGRGHEGRAIAVYAIARHLPLFFFGPVAGVVADRFDRRRVLIVADLARAFLALGFLLADRFASLPLIYLVGASLFSVSAFFNAAKRASIPNVVKDPRQLLTANSLSASTTAATIAVGSALGGVFATLAGRHAVIVVNALTFLVSAELIRRIATPMSKKREAAAEMQSDATRINDVATVRADEVTGVAAAEVFPSRGVTVEAMPPRRVAATRFGRAFDDFREGLRYVRRDKVLTAVFVVAGGWGLGNGAARALYSIFGARLGEQAAAGWLERPTDFGISVLFVAMGLGQVFAAPLARSINQGADLGSRMWRSMALDGVGLAVFALMPNLWVAAAVLFLRDMNFAIWWTAQQTLVMRRAEDAYAGRVFASYETLTTLAMVASMLLAGALSDTYGIRPVAVGGGVVITLSGLLWFLLRRGREVVR